MPKLTGSTRTIWIMAVTAVISLAAGLGLSRMIISPADAAAKAAPPEAGPITVPVEQRQLANDVVLRGDAIYEDPVAVSLETGDLGGPAIVTGGVPEVGSTLDAGQVMLEVAGRPVILLSGDLPVYRTLRVGVSGPDVLQLKAALGAVGINPGDAASDAYDAATAAAVVELYARVGYPAPTAGPDAQAAVDLARDAVRSAEEQLTTARQGVDHPEGGTVQSVRVAAQGRADVAHLQLQEHLAFCATTPDPAVEGAVEGHAQQCLGSARRQLESNLAAAIAERDEANAAPDTSGARAAVTSAQRALSDAQEDLADAQRDVLTPLPASEVVYLASTPRRVDSVEVKRGSTVSGTAVMNVSGATLQIAGSVSTSDAELIPAGSPVTIALPSGTEVPGTVESVGAPPADGAAGADDPNRKRVVVVPDALTDEQRAELQGANVRMTIPVSSTEGEVMAVPTAALTAGPGGEARVEVLSADGTSTLVTVETGLAADGFVEVTPVDGSLDVGDRVVVGVTAGADDAETETEAPADESTEESSDESTDEGSGEG